MFITEPMIALPAAQALFKRGIYVDPKRADIVPVQSQRGLKTIAENVLNLLGSQLAFKASLCKEWNVLSKCSKQQLHLVVTDCHKIPELLNCGIYLNCYKHLIFIMGFWTLGETAQGYRHEVGRCLIPTISRAEI